VKAGDAYDVLQTPRLLRWQRSVAAAMARWSPSFRRGRAMKTARARTVAPLPATLRLHLDVSILRQPQDRYVAKNAFASATEATRTMLPGCY